MDSPFAKEYQAQTGVNPSSQTVEENTSQSSPFAQEYQAQTGVAPALTPSDVTKASSNNLPTNPNTGSADYNGWCQAFVEQVTNSPQKFPSAIDAWNNYAQTGQAKQGTKGLQPGDIVYFSPNDSNEGAGHTGIFAGKGKFISATDNGVETNSLTDWEKQTGQQVLGYVKNPENLPHIGGIQ